MGSIFYSRQNNTHAWGQFHGARVKYRRRLRMTKEVGTLPSTSYPADMLPKGGAKHAIVMGGSVVFLIIWLMSGRRIGM